MYRELYTLFEYDRYSLRLSLHDPARKDKYAGGEDLWQRAETILRETLDELGMKYVVGMDEAAFYGPKIDIQFKNLLGREETVSTIQIDFLAAQKFDLHYIDEHGAEMPPVVIHRAPLSTHERIMAFLIEHYGGAFPTWMAPVQVRIIPIARRSHSSVRDDARRVARRPGPRRNRRVDPLLQQEDPQRQHREGPDPARDRPQGGRGGDGDGAAVQGRAAGDAAVRRVPRAACWRRSASGGT